MPGKLLRLRSELSDVTLQHMHGSEMSDKKTTTPREPLIVHVPTALTLVRSQVQSERKSDRPPPPSEDAKQATG